MGAYKAVRRSVKGYRCILRMILGTGMSALVFLLGACSAGGSVNILEKRLDISIIVKSGDEDYWKTVRAGAQAAARELGADIDFSVPAGGDNLNGQIKLIEAAEAKKSDALVLAPYGGEELAKSVEEACSGDMPVVAIDSDIDVKRVASFIATDNYEAGTKAGKELVELAGTKCRVAVLSCDMGEGNAGLREKGLYDVISRNVNIKVLAKEYCPSGMVSTEESIRRTISQNSRLDAIVALNADTSVTAAEVLKSEKLFDRIKLISFDCTPEEIEFLEDGVIRATVIQNPFSMGYLGVKYAVDAVNGKRAPKRVDTGSKVIDKSTMYLPENQKLLFPFVTGNVN